MVKSSRTRMMWLCVLVLALFVPLKPAAQSAQVQGSGQTFEGILTIQWGDPQFRESAGVIRYTLATPDNEYFAIETSQDANELLQLQRHRVVVTGRLAAASPASGGSGGNRVIVADAIADDPRVPLQAPFGDPQGVTGTKKVVFVLLRYADDAGVPHPPAFFNNLANPDPSVDATIPTTINQFFKKLSNNTFQWQADTWGAGGLNAPSGYLVLSEGKAGYANCGFSLQCFNTTKFTNEAIALAKASGLNFVPYDNINFVINNDLDCCAWGGSWTFDGKTYGTTWEPPWGQVTSTYGHEMGHSLGLPHSGWVYYSYDSPWDTMSNILAASTAVCGSYFSRNRVPPATVNIFCDQPGD